jgi:hypothetical protein
MVPSGAYSDSPIHQRERIAQSVKPLEVHHVAGNQLQAMRDGDGGNHRIAAADRLADPVEIAGDVAGEVSAGLVEESTASDAMALRKVWMRLDALTRCSP